MCRTIEALAFRSTHCCGNTSDYSATSTACGLSVLDSSSQPKDLCACTDSIEGVTVGHRWVGQYLKEGTRHVCRPRMLEMTDVLEMTGILKQERNVLSRLFH